MRRFLIDALAIALVAALIYFLICLLRLAESALGEGAGPMAAPIASCGTLER